MIKDIKAVAADIDGTLVEKGGMLPDVTRKAFDLLHENGVLLGLATGREIETKLLNQWKSWNMDYPFDFLVGMNGGMIYDRFSNEVEAMEFMPEEDALAIMHHMMPLIEKYKISVNAEGGGNHYAMNIQGVLLESAKRHGFIFDDATGNPELFCSKRLYKILFRGEPEQDEEIRSHFLEKFGDKYQMVGTYMGTVEAIAKGINKGEGLRKVAKKMRIPMENILTCGDNENDNSMLLASGWSVCVCDGAEKTQKCAKDITEKPCVDGGIGLYLIDNYLKPNGLM